MDDRGLVVVVFVSPKDEERELFSRGVSYGYESSLLLPSILPCIITLLGYTCNHSREQGN